MKKKIITIVITAVIMCVSVLSSVSVVSVASAESGGILVIGDGIAAGSGLGENEKSYVKIISEASGKTITDETDSSYRTADILKLVKTDKLKEEISQNDIVIISAGSNDIIEPVLETVSKMGCKTLDEAAEKISMSSDEVKALYKNLTSEKMDIEDGITEIYETVKTANPNARIVVQNIYNPLDINVQKLTVKLSTMKVTLESDVLEEINEVIAEFDGAYVADISKKFSGNADFYTNCENLDAMPVQAGHIAIAAEILDILGIKDKSNSMSDAIDNLSGDTKKTYIKDHTDDFKKTISYSTSQIGDVNGDGDVDAKDAVRILVYYANTLAEKEDTIDSTASDLNFDGVCNSNDAVLVLRFYAENLVNPGTTVIDFLKEAVN